MKLNQALKLIQKLNLDLGVLLWLSFKIILSGHAITTINIREETQHENLDYTLVFSFIRYLLFYPKIFVSSPIFILTTLTVPDRLMLELAKYTQGQEIGNRLFM